MDVEKCKALISAIENGSITTAADKLNFTPSGISRSIASLEEQLGFSLLIRGKMGVKPTKECEQILPQIRSLVNTQESLLQRAALIKGAESGSLAIGTAYPAYNRLLSEKIVEFRKDHPAIEISLIEGTSSSLCDMLGEHRIDLCIVSKRDNIPVFRPLISDYICAWVSDDHPAVREKVYNIERLKEDNYIQMYPDVETDNSIFLKEHHLKPRICASTSDVFAAYTMVETGMGVALINHILADRWNGKVTVLPLDVKSEISIGLAVPYPQDRSPAAEMFMEYLADA